MNFPKLNFVAAQINFLRIADETASFHIGNTLDIHWYKASSVFATHPYFSKLQLGHK